MFNSILCRYNEIATKGNNRSMFETRLIDNMRNLCDSQNHLKFSRIRGRIFVDKKDNTDFTQTEMDSLAEAMARCFGLDSFSFARKCAPLPDEIYRAILLCVTPDFLARIEQSGRVEFRSRVNRADKTFPVRSRDLEIEIATQIEQKFGPDSVKVNLSSPDISIGVDIRAAEALIYFDSVKAPGGLPVGSNAPVLALLSGGIDSPVACNMVMKRGCHVDFLTFHSFPYTPMASVEKVQRIATVLARWQRTSSLFACNISEIQKAIRDYCDPRFRTVLYRRMMMRIAAAIAEQNQLAALVTGESVGQVASQTVENMSVIDQSTDLLILRPLAGLDKNETILRAQKLQTFDISIEPMIDSCTVFAPKSPALHAKLHTVEFEEAKIPNMTDLVNDAVQKITKIKIHFDGTCDGTLTPPVTDEMTDEMTDAVKP